MGTEKKGNVPDMRRNLPPLLVWTVIATSISPPLSLSMMLCASSTIRGPAFVHSLFALTALMNHSGVVTIKNRSATFLSFPVLSPTTFAPHIPTDSRYRLLTSSRVGAVITTLSPSSRKHLEAPSSVSGMLAAGTFSEYLPLVYHLPFLRRLLHGV